MRCPVHGPRADAEFKRIGKDVPHAKGEGAPLDLWKHKCGQFVWRIAESQRLQVVQ